MFGLLLQGDGGGELGECCQSLMLSFILVFKFSVLSCTTTYLTLEFYIVWGVRGAGKLDRAEYFQSLILSVIIFNFHLKLCYMLFIYIKVALHMEHVNF